MTARPILFSGPMVQALLDGRKTQTRRMIRIPEMVRSEAGDHDLTAIEWCDQHESGPGFYAWLTEYPDEGSAPVSCRYGAPGDQLWVREKLVALGEIMAYAEDRAPVMQGGLMWPSLGERSAIPSIHMPRWASRITLEITEVRVQRVQEISEQDANEEGCTLLGLTVETTDDLSLVPVFKKLWESINGAGSWEANPWVWCVSFEKVRT